MKDPILPEAPVNEGLNDVSVRFKYSTLTSNKFAISREYI